MTQNIYIGTSGWHYDDWVGIFYPPEITGYKELRFFSERFNSVENNSSFYRIAGETTYKTWSRMTPGHFKFSMKLNRIMTHVHRLELNEEVREKVRHILASTQVLKEKLGAIVIQLPPSFRFDPDKLARFLEFFRSEMDLREYKFDIAIEFRNKYWFVEETYRLLRTHNVALVVAQSSRYPGAREVTADFAYIRLHGPKELFASKYTTKQLEDWAAYIERVSGEVDRIYIYFNNDFHGYALDNARELAEMLGIGPFLIE